MKSLVEELRAGAELEEVYDADGIIRTGYQLSLRWRAADEIERLREELSHCLHLDNHNAIVRNLQEAAVVVTAEKDAEIERLRGLLRDTLDMYKDGPWADAYWIKRVREALGDE